jgi:hypothetical protein
MKKQYIYIGIIIVVLIAIFFVYQKYLAPGTIYNPIDDGNIILNKKAN